MMYLEFGHSLSYNLKYICDAWLSIFPFSLFLSLDHRQRDFLFHCRFTKPNFIACILTITFSRSFNCTTWLPLNEHFFTIPIKKSKKKTAKFHQSYMHYTKKDERNSTKLHAQLIYILSNPFSLFLYFPYTLFLFFSLYDDFIQLLAFLFLTNIWFYLFQ